jgi:hypothetical protein
MSLARQFQDIKPASNKPTPVANGPVAVANTASAKRKPGRYLDPDAGREYMKALMPERRAADLARRALAEAG